MNNEELVWVEKEFAEKYNLLKSDKFKQEERIKIFNEYIDTMKEAARTEFKIQLESLEEDAAIYTGLMLKVKQAFEKAKNEQLEASYQLWDKFDKEIPSITEKINNIIEKLEPLKKKIETLNELLGKIDSYKIDNVREAIEKLSTLYGNSKEMIDFVVKNFQYKEIS